MSKKAQDVNTDAVQSAETEAAPAAKPKAEHKAEHKTEHKAEQKVKPDDVVLTKAEFEKVKEHIEKLQNENSAMTDTAKRLQAEFDNYRRRNANLHKDAVDEGVRMAITQLLPVLDNYERALSALDSEDGAEKSGIQLIFKQLLSSLEKLGLAEIDTGGKFDPNFHDAVMQETVEGAESGDILLVLQKGYKVNDRIIRHSMVKVAE